MRVLRVYLWESFFVHVITLRISKYDSRGLSRRTLSPVRFQETEEEGEGKAMWGQKQGWRQVPSAPCFMGKKTETPRGQEEVGLGSTCLLPAHALDLSAGLSNAGNQSALSLWFCHQASFW